MTIFTKNRIFIYIELTPKEKLGFLFFYVDSWNEQTQPLNHQGRYQGRCYRSCHRHQHHRQ